MTYATVIMGPERRRRWNADDRRRIVSAAFSPGAVVTQVARANDVSTALIYRWRREAQAGRGEVVFSPVVLVDEPASTDAARASAPEAPAIVVELGGARVSIGAGASAVLVAATLRALRS